MVLAVSPHTCILWQSGGLSYSLGIQTTRQEIRPFTQNSFACVFQRLLLKQQMLTMLTVRGAAWFKFNFVLKHAGAHNTSSRLNAVAGILALMHLLLNKNVPDRGSRTSFVTCNNAWITVYTAVRCYQLFVTGAPYWQIRFIGTCPSINLP